MIRVDAAFIYMFGVCFCFWPNRTTAKEKESVLCLNAGDCVAVTRRLGSFLPLNNNIDVKNNVDLRGYYW